MSRPEEEERAITGAYELLHELVTTARYPRCTPAIRERACALLRHYPGPTRTAQIFADAQRVPPRGGECSCFCHGVEFCDCACQAALRGANASEAGR